MTFARELWRRVETLHAVTYFSEQARAAAKAVGLRGFWMGYFGSRAAPLGPVGPAVVEAIFYNFAPDMVRRSIPDAWSFASPATIVDVRVRAAAEALRAVSRDADEIADALVPRLAGAAARGAAEGRPLFAANRDLADRDDPVEALWQACTTIREHRGDGHVAALADAQLDGLEAHVLFAAHHDVPVELLRDNRGWTEAHWDAAGARLQARGLIDQRGTITADGRTLREQVEATTDRLAARLFDDLEPGDQIALLERLDPLVDAVAGARIIPFPNPMGLPARAPDRSAGG